METFLFFLSAFVSEIVGTIAGFGSSTVFLPLALFFFDFKTALVLVAVFHLFGNVSRAAFFKKGINKEILFSFGLSSVIATIIGALLVSIVRQELLKTVLGGFLVIYSLFSLRKNSVKIRNSVFNRAIGGGISGFLAGLIGTGGALRGAFLTAFSLSKERYIATSALIAVVVDVTRIPIYLTQGFLSSSFYWYVPPLFLLAVIGSFAGKRIVERVPQKTFKKIVLLAIFLAGLKLIIVK